MQEKDVRDFSIADYWDVEKVFPDFYSKQGVSLVFVNNIKAQYFFLNLTILRSNYLNMV